MPLSPLEIERGEKPIRRGGDRPAVHSCHHSEPVDGIGDVCRIQGFTGVLGESSNGDPEYSASFHAQAPKEKDVSSGAYLIARGTTIIAQLLRFLSSFSIYSLVTVTTKLRYLHMNETT